MLYETITSGAGKNGYHWAKTHSWNSPEMDAAKAEAVEMFYELRRLGNLYIRLVESHHEYSKGYWLELYESKLAPEDKTILGWGLLTYDDVIKLLEAVEDINGYNLVCQGLIKPAFANGYPDWWFPKMIKTGKLSEILAPLERKVNIES